MPDAPAQPVFSTDFRRVVCGIDNSPISREAARQSAALAAEGAHLWGVAVWDPGLAMHAGIHASSVAADLRREAYQALRRAEGEVPGLEPMMIQGAEVAGMLGAIDDVEADLVGVGAHGTSRAGVVFGSMAGSMARHAPCSVLIGRETGDHDFPGLILHASDGSSESLAAARTAGRIAARSGAGIVTLHVGDDLEHARAIAEESVGMIEDCGREPVSEIKDGTPHRRIVEFAGAIGASLITIGSRGRTGLRALGSVSERVAHRAPCSVLIVRRTAHPSIEREGPSASTTEDSSSPRTEAAAQHGD